MDTESVADDTALSALIDIGDPAATNEEKLTVPLDKFLEWHKQVAATENDLCQGKESITKLYLNQLRFRLGVIEPDVVALMVEKARITRKDRFVDLQSGSGSVVAQISSTVGCPCIGIESVYELNRVAAKMQSLFVEAFDGYAFGSFRLFDGNYADRKFLRLLAGASVIYSPCIGHKFAVNQVTAQAFELFERTIFEIAMLADEGIRIISLYEIKSLEILGDCFMRERGPSKDKTIVGKNRKSLYFFHFNVYTKVSSTWKCAECGHMNPSVDEDTNEMMLKCGSCGVVLEYQTKVNLSSD